MDRRGTLLLCAGMLAALPLAADDLAEQLFAASRTGDVAAIKALLAKGADVNAKARYDRTALSFAAHRGHLEAVKLLLDSGADPNVKDSFYGATALSLAGSEGHYAVIRLLLTKGAAGGEEALMNGVFSNRAELVRAVLETTKAGAETLSAALAVATRTKRAEIVELLEKAGAVPPPPANFAVDLETLKTYEGLYRSDRGLEVSFAVKDGKLVGTIGSRTSELGGVNKTTFRLADRPEETITFDLEGGKVVGFTSRTGPTAFVFRRVEASPKP
jgi:hypothetical protein